MMAERTAGTNVLYIYFNLCIILNKYRQDLYESPVAKKRNVIAKLIVHDYLLLSQ